MANKNSDNTRESAEETDVEVVEKKREGRHFLGSFISSENRQRFLMTFRKEYEEQYIDKHEGDDLECSVAAEKYAAFQVNRLQKEFQAFLKGKDFFIYKKMVYPVTTDKFIENSTSVSDRITDGILEKQEEE